jgi:hypothetical protein
MILVGLVHKNWPALNIIPPTAVGGMTTLAGTSALGMRLKGGMRFGASSASVLCPKLEPLLERGMTSRGSDLQV